MYLIIRSRSCRRVRANIMSARWCTGTRTILTGSFGGIESCCTILRRWERNPVYIFPSTSTVWKVIQLVRGLHKQIIYSMQQSPWRKEFDISYPNILSSSVALYWEGISIKAASANSVSFLDRSMFFDIISVKFTNYRRRKNNRKVKFIIIESINKPCSAQLTDNFLTEDTCLEIIKCSGRDVIIKFFHHIPWSISNSN